MITEKYVLLKFETLSNYVHKDLRHEKLARLLGTASSKKDTLHTLATLG